MIGEFERYHGVVLRSMIVECGSLAVTAIDLQGRVNIFKLNERIGLIIKHSTARLPPWQFTYDDRQMEEIEDTRRSCEDFWFAHVCGNDGVMCIAYEEFCLINPAWASTTFFVRVDKGRSTRYRVFGTNGELQGKKSRGVGSVVKSVLGLL